MARWLMAVLACALASAPVAAATPREMLVDAAFSARDRPSAEAELAGAKDAAEAILARRPDDREARMQRALAIGYLAKLKGSRSDALAARRQIEALAAADPRDPEAQMALAGWHLNAITELGGMVARAALGARNALGFAALDRAVVLGRDHATFPAMAGLMRIRSDAGDVIRARKLAELAAATPAPTPLDRIMQKSAAAILVPLRAGDGTAAAALARRLLPFGLLPKK